MSDAPPVSIVVAARDELPRLPVLASALAAQTATGRVPPEIVFVDDASTDGSADAFALLLPAARVIRVDEPVQPRKKNALSIGIAAASHEALLFTDADCEPPRLWSAAMALYHAPGSRTVVVGYSPFLPARGLLNRFARYETFVAGFAAAAAVGLNRPYMAVGRNLSYPASLFHEGGGFAHSERSMSGDDDLMVQHLATLPDVSFQHAFGSDTYVPTDPPETWRAWLRQKLRHTSAGRYYTRDVKRHLAAYHISATLVWLAPLFAGWVGAGCLGLRLAWQHAVLRRAARVLGEGDLMAAHPLYELLYFVYNALVAPVGVLRKPARW